MSFARQEDSLVVILDNVRSSTISVLFSDCRCIPGRGDPVVRHHGYPSNVEIHKTALGAEDAVTWATLKTH